MRILLNILILSLLINFTMSIKADNTNNIIDTPVSVDKRIKTFIYNPNEIYKIMVGFGFQTIVQFAEDEEIQTISIGDTYSWKINSSGNILFISPLQEKVYTNMYLITNKRKYYFDLVSNSSTDVVSDEIAYEVRFFYPKTK